METALQNLNGILDELRLAGLDGGDVAQEIRDFLSDPLNADAMVVSRTFHGRKLDFELFLKTDEHGKFHFSAYALLLEPLYPKLKHFARNGVNSRDLKARMAKIDWSLHPGHFFAAHYKKNDEIRNQMDVVFKDLYSFTRPVIRGDIKQLLRANQLADQLMFRYFRGMPLEKAITKDIPWRKDTFCHLIQFPPHIHIGVPGNHSADIEILEQLSAAAHNMNHKNQFLMNLNNLENLKAEMTTLGFRPQLIEKMEEQVKAGSPEFTLKDQLTGHKGQVDINVYFKQSGQSENYYLNKFDVSLNDWKTLEEGQKFLVISPSDTPGKNNVWKRESVAEAIEVFKKQTGNAELAVGKDAAHKTQLALMEDGKINYVEKDFGRVFRNPPLPQTIWVDRGKGFTAPQAVNLIEGRAVYREDMLTQGGMAYKAWMKLDLDGPRDRHLNYNMNQYHDPSYGFSLKEVLDKFNIKELENPKERAKLESQLKNGDRPEITVEKNGQQVKLYLEAVPRYSQLNMYAANGRPEKREQFLKENDQKQDLSKSKTKEKNVSQGQGLEI